MTENIQQLIDTIFQFSLFGNSIELIRIIYIIGLLIAIAFRRKFGYNPGGLIVPGMLAITLGQNVLWFLLIIPQTLLTFYIYKLAFGGKALRGKYPLLIFSGISVIISLITQFILTSGFGASPEMLITYLIPGLIANNIYKKDDVSILATAYGIGSLLALIGFGLSQIIPYFELTQIERLNAGREVMQVDYLGIQFFFSIIITFLLYHFFKLRAGGLMLLPIIAAILISPLHFLVLIVLATLTFLVVHFVQKYSFFVGISRFALSLVIAILIGWILELAIFQLTNVTGVLTTFSPLYGTTILFSLIAASWVNDINVQSFKNSLIGSGAGTFIALITQQLILVLA